MPGHSFGSFIASNMINIGKLIREELARQNRSAGWLAAEINCNRSTVYRLLERNSIDTAVLARISKVLQVDFFKMFSDGLAEQP